MQDIIIFGAGGFSKDVHFMIDYINHGTPQFNLLGFLDDNKEQPAQINGVPYLGTREYLAGINKPLGMVIAINNKDAVSGIVAEAKNNPNISFPNIIHPTCVVDYAYVSMGVGNIINAGCLISRNTAIGNFNILNNHVAIGHDVVIGDFNLYGPKTQISGGVRIGNNNFFGLGASVLQYKEIGNNNMIGACSLVTKNLKDDRNVFGVPAKNLPV